jgi:hypothetical protein
MKRTTSLALGTIAVLAYQLYKAHPEWHPAQGTKGRRKGKAKAKAR